MVCQTPQKCPLQEWQTITILLFNVLRCDRDVVMEAFEQKNFPIMLAPVGLRCKKEAFILAIFFNLDRLNGSFRGREHWNMLVKIIFRIQS